MPQIAMLSDIHGNLEGLEAVLADIQRRGIQRILCLGDIVGYGPNPVECTLLVRERCEWSILGNHDEAVFVPPTRWNGHAVDAINWTVLQIANHSNAAERKAAAQYLKTLKRGRVEGKLCFVHGSPSDPVEEYLFPQDAEDCRKIQRNMDLIEWVSFQGHTHMPGIFRASTDFLGQFDFDKGRTAPNEPTVKDKVLVQHGQKALINVGSAGQPRDYIPDACYLIVDELPSGCLELEWASCAYDVEKTIAKMQAFPQLTKSERLRGGW